MDMEKNVCIKAYMDIAPFLCGIFGPTCGIVLYDVDEAQNDGKVIATFGMDTSREVGDPMTLFVKRALSRIIDETLTSLSHVDTTTSTSKGRVRLDFFPIRISSGALIGLFVVCNQIDLLYDIRETVGRILGFGSDPVTNVKAIGDEVPVSLSQYMQQLIHKEIEAYGIPVERMTMAEKSEIIKKMEKLEVFYVKASVHTVADLLDISVPTLYRLMKRE